MELSQYLGRIWHWMWLILAIAVAAVILDIGILWVLPRQYTATSMLEVGGIQALLGTPGTQKDTRQTLPSAIQSSTQTYLSLLQSASVKQEALTRVQGQNTLTQNSAGSSSSASPVTGSDFTYQGRGEAVRGGDTDIIYIDVQADQPATAKAYADSLATVLVEQADKLSGDTADEFARNIQEQQVDPINKRMADIRAEIEQLRANTTIDATERNIKLSNLSDEATALDGTRKNYTDTISRMRLNEALNRNDLQVMSVAALPTAKEQPNYLRTGIVAGATGLIVGLIIVLFVDRRKSSKAATVF